MSSLLQFIKVKNSDLFFVIIIKMVYNVQILMHVRILNKSETLLSSKAFVSKRYQILISFNVV